MRVVQSSKMKLGEVDVSMIEFDLKSRDDMPKILRGLQFLYNDTALRAALFTLLETRLLIKSGKPRRSVSLNEGSPEGGTQGRSVNGHTGRPGMTLWMVFVCALVRLDLNIDYDQLHDLVNNHKTRSKRC